MSKSRSRMSRLEWTSIYTPSILKGAEHDIIEEIQHYAGNPQNSSVPESVDDGCGTQVKH